MLVRSNEWVDARKVWGFAQDLLYVLLLVNDKVVTLLRPRKHSIHPTGAFTIGRCVRAMACDSPRLITLTPDLHLLMNVLKSSPGLKSSETWLPLCLPKFNPNGFVYALIDYVKENIGLIFVSADREGFEQLQGWKRRVVRVSGGVRLGSMGRVVRDLMGRYVL